MRTQPTDIAFRNLDTPETPQNIACLIRMHGTVDREEFIRRAVSVTEFFPRMSLRFEQSISGHWKKNRPELIPVENFDIAKQISFRTLKPEEAARLDDIVVEEFTRPFDEQLSPWRFVIFEHGANSSNTGFETTGLLVFHHSVTDGLGGLEVLNAFCAAKSPQESKHRRDRRAPPLEPTQWNLSIALSAGKTILRMLLHRPPNLFQGVNSSQRKITTVKLPLINLQKAKRRLGGTTNDVYLYIVSETVRRYAAKHNVTDLSDPVAIVPISLRQLSMRNELGNYLTGVGVRLPGGEMPDELRMRKIQTNARSLRDPLAVGSYKLLSELGVRLPKQLQPFFFSTLARCTSFITTNLPDARVEEKLAGAIVKEKYGLPALMKGHGVGFALITYAQQACIAMVTDPNIISDPSTLAQILAEVAATIAD